MRPAFAAAKAYRWTTYAPGQTVQYGAANSDERLLRIDCLQGRHGHRLEMVGPAHIVAKRGARVAVTIAASRGPKKRAGRIVALSDGPNFAIRIKAGDDALQTLLKGRPLSLSSGGQTWTVPGDGAAAVIEPLVKSCSVSKRTRQEHR